MNTATHLRTHAAASIDPRVSHHRIAYMHLGLQWMAYDVDGGPTAYALGDTKAQAAEELETKLLERA